MRKLRVFESISIDGFFADEAGDMSFAHRGSDDAEYAAWVSGNARPDAELLLGRKTYEMMEAFWPTPLASAQMPEVARGMNAATKHVATTTLTPTWQNSRRLEGPLVEAVRALKAQDGPGLTVLGSGSVVAQLGEAGLVDEYQLVLLPVALGKGRSIFTSRRALTLLEHRVFRSGQVVLTYGAEAG